MSDNGIWKFVESKLNCKVPEYIKNVLEGCGYTNGITIATIEQADIKYFEDEVKNGNVSKHFGDDKDVLAGSNKTKENFEIVRGHMKLLMQIRDFVKSRLDLNGPESFTLEPALEANKENKKETGAVVDEEKRSLKRKNDSKNSVVKSKFSINCSEEISEEDANKHREVIYPKMILALNQLTSDMLSKVKEKISPDLVNIQVVTKKASKRDDGPSDEDGIVYALVADVRCIYCSQPIRVFYTPTEKNAFVWSTSNFNRHLIIVHKGSKEHNNKKIRNKNGETIGKPESQIQSESNEIVAPSSTANQFDSMASGAEKNEPSIHQPETNKSVELKSNENAEENLEENFEITGCSKKSESSNTTFSIRSRIVCYSDSSDDDFADDQCGKNEDQTNGQAEKKIDNALPQTTTVDIGVDVLETYSTNEVASIPIIRNGHSSTDKKGKQTIVTRNTCSFDSIFSIYACLYFDVVEFRKLFATLKEKSSFAKLIQTYHSMFNAKTKVDPSELSNLYADRNNILKEVFTKSTYHLNTNVKKKDELLVIDCHTAIGRLFGQICMGVCPYIASAIEIKTCESCEKKSRAVLPFIPVAVNGLDLTNVQKSICPIKCKGRCNNCKGKYTVELIYNNVLVLEVEPNTIVKNQKKISIRNVAQTIVVENEFYLCAIIEFDPKIRHFKSHIKRKNEQWITHDDIQIAENKIDEFEEVLPYMLFYAKSEFDEDLVKAWHVKLSKNSARGKKGEHESATSKNLEKKWKY